MELIATPLSHFSRKVRLLLHHYGLAYTITAPANVAVADPSQFADNPLMSVPVLRDGERWLIEADHIAAYVVRRCDPADRFNVLSSDADVLNARAVMNGVMAKEVTVLLAERMGGAPEGHPFFAKARQAIAQGLAWLEARADHFDPDAPDYAAFHLVSMLDHLAYYDTAAAPGPRLSAFARQVGERALVRQSSPFVLQPKPAPD